MSILFCMVRTRTFDPGTALSQAVDLFSAKGYSETSMEDVVRATGVSRYGLYGTFGNKRELFEQALEEYAQRMGKKAYVRLHKPDASLEHIRAIFVDRIEDLCCEEENKGCLFIHTAMQLAPTDDDLRQVLHRFMQQMSMSFKVGLDSAKQRGEVCAGLDTVAAADLLTSTVFGIVVLGRTGFPKEALLGIVDSTLGAMMA